MLEKLRINYFSILRVVYKKIKALNNYEMLW